MNFFFGFNNNFLKSKLTIPKFNNSSIKKDYSVFSAKPENNEWIVDKVICEQDDYFYFINNDRIKNNLIFFLANQKEIKKNTFKDIKDFSKINNFTDTKPSAFRANLELYTEEGGFSSYQSEYPNFMTTKNGNILSPVDILLDKHAERNSILFKNIYYLPNNEQSKIYFLNIKSKKVLDVKTIKNNFSNHIEVDKDLINKNVYIFSEKALGIPLYISIKNKHISFEHTHPPHHYILSENQFSLTGELKKKIKKFIDESN